jgi:hypothetical protein
LQQPGDYCNKRHVYLKALLTYEHSNVVRDYEAVPDDGKKKRDNVN